MKQNAGEFEKFDAGMKQVLSVSRVELKAREEEWKKQRLEKKKGKAKTSFPATAASSTRT
jgi:hypothetical protein